MTTIKTSKMTVTRAPGDPPDGVRTFWCAFRDETGNVKTETVELLPDPNELPEEIDEKIINALRDRGHEVVDDDDTQVSL